jgi:hypothetical protein
VFACWANDLEVINIDTAINNAIIAVSADKMTAFANAISFLFTDVSFHWFLVLVRFEQASGFEGQSLWIWSNFLKDAGPESGPYRVCLRIHELRVKPNTRQKRVHRLH